MTANEAQILIENVTAILPPNELETMRDYGLRAREAGLLTATEAYRVFMVNMDSIWDGSSFVLAKG